MLFKTYFKCPVCYTFSPNSFGQSCSFLYVILDMANHTSSEHLSGYPYHASYYGGRITYIIISFSML